MGGRIEPARDAGESWALPTFVAKTLVAQAMSFPPWKSFPRIVRRCQGDRLVRSLRCSEDYRTPAFAQSTGREGLRDLEDCLAARPSKLYDSGFRSPIRRSTLADANERRDWRIYGDVSLSSCCATPSDHTHAIAGSASKRGVPNSF